MMIQIFLEGKIWVIQVLIAVPDRIEYNIRSVYNSPKTKAYSVDLRQKTIDVHTQEEISQRQLADRFKVSLSTIQRFLKRARNGEGLSSQAHGGGNPPKLTAEQLEKVRVHINAHNDATLVELCDWVYEQEKVQVSRSTMGRITQSLGFSRKKNAARQ